MLLRGKHRTRILMINGLFCEQEERLLKEKRQYEHIKIRPCLKCSPHKTKSKPEQLDNSVFKRK
jgi:hypothetical protein